jgi:hypothetical protein
MSGLKVEIFGIGDAVNASQKNYLFEEGSAPFRAAIKKDQVISCLHDYLLPIKKPNLELTADNCSSQNKNQWLMYYLCWRVMKGLQKKIQLNFMIAGHTKFYCDSNFGSFKSKLRTADIWNSSDLKQLIDNSSVVNIAIHDIEFDHFSFSDYCDSMGTKALPEITKMHVMSFSSEYVGVMRYKFYSDDIEWQQVRLFNENQTLLDFEQILQKYGLLNGQELSDKRLDELDKHKQFLVLSDRQKFAPHLNDQFQRYRERKLLILYQKHIASIKNHNQKSAKYKTKVASYAPKKAKTEAI